MTQIQLFITEFEYYMITNFVERKPAKTQRDMTIINIIRIMIATFLEPGGDFSPRNLEIR